MGNMMVTRDPDYPAEWAALFQAFNRASAGYSLDGVLDATVNFLCASARQYAVANEFEPDQVEDFIQHVMAMQPARRL